MIPSSQQYKHILFLCSQMSPCCDVSLAMPPSRFNHIMMTSRRLRFNSVNYPVANRRQTLNVTATSQHLHKKIRPILVGREVYSPNKILYLSFLQFSFSRLLLPTTWTRHFVVYLTMLLVAQIIRRRLIGKETERSFRGAISTFARRNWGKSRKTSSRIARNLAEIWTRELHISKQKC